jgi:hypothetical protein
MKLLFGILILIALVIILMRLTCIGLWGRLKYRIPHNLVKENKNEPLEYKKCAYVGFKYLFK